MFAGAPRRRGGTQTPRAGGAAKTDAAPESTKEAEDAAELDALTARAHTFLADNSTARVTAELAAYAAMASRCSERFKREVDLTTMEEHFGRGSGWLEVLALIDRAGSGAIDKAADRIPIGGIAGWLFKKAAAAVPKKLWSLPFASKKAHDKTIAQEFQQVVFDASDEGNAALVMKTVMQMAGVIDEARNLGALEQALARFEHGRTTERADELRRLLSESVSPVELLRGAGGLLEAETTSLIGQFRAAFQAANTKFLNDQGVSVAINMYWDPVQGWTVIRDIPGKRPVVEGATGIGPERVHKILAQLERFTGVSDLVELDVPQSVTFFTLGWEDSEAIPSMGLLVPLDWPTIRMRGGRVTHGTMPPDPKPRERWDGMSNERVD